MKRLSADEKMTIFYSRITGDIKGYTTGISDIGFFGDDAVDMEIIYNYVIVDLDDYVINNTDQFKVENERIKLKSDIDLGKYL